MNWYSLSDKALTKEIGRFIKQNRLDQNRSQEWVANKAGISRSTLSLLEKGEAGTISSLLQVLRVLELLHVMDTFFVSDQISPLELAKHDLKKRKRSSPIPIRKQSNSEW